MHRGHQRATNKIIIKGFKLGETFGVISASPSSDAVVIHIETKTYLSTTNTYEGKLITFLSYL